MVLQAIPMNTQLNTNIHKKLFQSFYDLIKKKGIMFFIRVHFTLLFMKNIVQKIISM